MSHVYIAVHVLIKNMCTSTYCKLIFIDWAVSTKMEAISYAYCVNDTHHFQK